MMEHDNPCLRLTCGALTALAFTNMEALEPVIRNSAGCLSIIMGLLALYAWPSSPAGMRAAERFRKNKDMLKRFFLAFWAWLKQVAFHAHDKVTAYVGLGIAGFGSLQAQQIEDIRNHWSDWTSYLPDWAWVHWAEAHIFVILGFVVIYTRVRRLLPTGAKECSPSSGP